MVIVSHKNQYHFWGLLVFVEHSFTQSTTLSLSSFSLSQPLLPCLPLLFLLLCLPRSLASPHLPILLSISTCPLCVDVQLCALLGDPLGGLRLGFRHSR